MRQAIKDKVKKHMFTDTNNSVVTINTSIPCLMYIYEILLEHEHDPLAKEFLDAADNVICSIVKSL